MQIRMTQVAQAVSGIDAECLTQLEHARRFIGHEEAVRAWLNENFGSLPVVLDKAMVTDIEYKDDRKKAASKEQHVNDMLWLFVLNIVLDSERMYFQKKYVATAIKEYTSVDDATANEWAGLYKEAMVSHGILTRAVTKLGRMFIHAVSQDLRDELVQRVSELKMLAAMTCKPLLNKPERWTSVVDGVSVNFKHPLITGANPNVGVSSTVLSAVNKLQDVAYVFDKDVLNWCILQLDRSDLEAEDERLYQAIRNLPRDGQAFYFPVTMDWRGRMYYRGGMITPQGNKVLKAGLRYAQSEVLTKTGKAGLALHVANELGFDKDTIENRMAVLARASVLSRMDNLWKSLKDGSCAEKDLMAAVCSKEWVSMLAVEAMSGDEFESNLICYTDGTCNGLQWAAVFTGDRATAESVNCTASSVSEAPKDIYGIVAKKAEEFAEGEALEYIKAHGRNGAKNAVMITGYGAGASTVKNNIPHEEADAIGEAYLAAIDEVAGGINSFTRAMKLRAEEALRNKQDTIAWFTEDGFRCEQQYRITEEMRVRCNDELVVLDTSIKASIDEIKMIGALSPNFTHSVDATHLRAVINRCAHSCTAIHDSIGTHANHVVKTTKYVREEFARLGTANLLGDLCANMNATVPAKVGDYNAKEALKSPYLFS